ncbi:MAG: rod shape-determining protein MreC [Pseudomonadota bacterium]
MTEPESHDSSVFSARGGSAAALSIYTLICVVLMVADHHGSFLDRVRSLLSVAAQPIVAAVHWPIDASRATAEFFAEREALVSRNEELEQRWLLARAELTRFAALQDENTRLRALLETSPRLGDKVVIAELLAVDLDPFTHRIMIDRGTESDVFLGQPIADAGGIIGQIEQVQPFSAFARLITDPSHAIPVLVNRTGMRSIAYGLGQTDLLLLRDVPRSADISPGDLVVTSGLGGRFPAGFPVGTVTELNRETGTPFLTVELKPSAAIDASREVLLVWPKDETAARTADSRTP